MKIIRTKHFPPGNYTAINLFGVVFSKVELSEEEKHHEYIHTQQMRRLLYVGFYVWYVIEWIYLIIKYSFQALARCGSQDIPQNSKLKTQNSIFYRAYRNIHFEREAYDHQKDYLLGNF